MDTLQSAGINDFLGIAIVGVVLSFIIKVIKDKYGPEANTTKILTVILSIVVGGLYYYIRSTPIYQTVLGVLAAASTVYALFLK